MPGDEHIPCAALQVALARIDALERGQERQTSQLDDIQGQIRGVNERIDALSDKIQGRLDGLRTQSQQILTTAITLLVPVVAGLLYLILQHALVGGLKP